MILDEFQHEPQIAYFSMEIALRDDIGTYAGGLGVLAGDTLRSAADLDVPMVAVTLVSRMGYFRQEIDANGRQIERNDVWEPDKLTQPLGAKIALQIEGREVWVRSWLYTVQGCAVIGARSFCWIRTSTKITARIARSRIASTAAMRLIVSNRRSCWVSAGCACCVRSDSGSASTI